MGSYFPPGGGDIPDPLQVENLVVTGSGANGTATIDTLNVASSTLSVLENARIGFYEALPILQQTGVPVTIAAVHAALVNLGLITA